MQHSRLHRTDMALPEYFHNNNFIQPQFICYIFIHCHSHRSIYENETSYHYLNMSCHTWRTLVNLSLLDDSPRTPAHAENAVAEPISLLTVALVTFAFAFSVLILLVGPAILKCFGFPYPKQSLSDLSSTDLALLLFFLRKSFFGAITIILRRRTYQKHRTSGSFIWGVLSR